ncbi:hypothetical protein PVAG01_08462 [Phlyctema vagabunda]|uniref:EGF-like domain-containing protein n=1 Tax=Phlyctema vagabunda TaxID=108571 RepID=A0ABR4P9I7_9HELO
MNQNQQRSPPKRPGGGGDRGGSVRRARERVEAGLPPEMPPPVQRPYDSTPAAPNQLRPRPQMPPALAGSIARQGPIGVAISRPTQIPQWPLAGSTESGPDGPTQQYKPPVGRGPPPQRPPRPSRVPSILDSSRLQEHTPSFPYRPQQQDEYDGDEDLLSPMARSPMTGSSRPSTVSSVGTIPDFPLPDMPPNGLPRRSANLGPPPLSRRGASSYYSQASFVSPIPEERTPTRSHGSYASSAAIPSNWGSESNYDGYDEELSPTRTITMGDVIEEGRESRGSQNDDNEERGLVRQASVGKRAKPSMIMTSSSDKMPTMQRLAAPTSLGSSKLERMGVLPFPSPNPTATPPEPEYRVSGEEKRETAWPIAGDMNSPLAGGTGLIETSSSETVPTLATAMTTDSREPAPVITQDSRTKEMLAAYNGASSLAPGGVTPTRTPSPGFSRLSAIRRPPRLDIDAVRDAEARGSLTSLPDLIRRATRLASMMDRGKRPASRMNDLNDFPFVNDEKNERGYYGELDDKHRSGLSGMLAAFPPPGVATPREAGSRATSPWPSPYRMDSAGGLTERDSQPRKKRRCCGLPLWGFLVVLLILLIIIAAAIVVPLELLVFNKTKSGAANSDAALAACQTQLVCQNGGTNDISSGVCSCLCTNGFTGTTCTIAGEDGCSSISMDSTSNATIGNAISRLIDGAQSNFSIPLSTNVILSRFNAANLSCVSENALVTFDGLDSRVGQSADVIVPTSTNLGKRQESTTLSTADATQSDSSGQSFSFGSDPKTVSLFPTTSVVTSVFGTPAASTAPQDLSLTNSQASPSTTSASATGTSSSTATSATASSFQVTEKILDFSRVAVLFVLQQEALDNAITAQSAIQRFFTASTSTSATAANISIGNGNTINLVDLSVNLGNGTVGSNNAGSSSAKRWMAVHKKLFLS